MRMMKTTAGRLDPPWLGRGSNLEGPTVAIGGSRSFANLGGGLGFPSFPPSPFHSWLLGQRHRQGTAGWLDWGGARIWRKADRGPRRRWSRPFANRAGGWGKMILSRSFVGSPENPF